MAIKYRDEEINNYNNIIIKFLPKGKIFSVLDNSIVTTTQANEPFQISLLNVENSIYRSRHAGNRVILANEEELMIHTNLNDTLHWTGNINSNIGLENLAKIIKWTTLISILNEKGFQHYENDYLDIVYSGKVTENRIKEKSFRMQEELNKLVSKYSIENLSKIKIVWFSSSEEGASLLTRPLGFAFPQNHLIFMHDQQTPTHEISHILSYLKMGSTKSNFLNEGFSVINDGTNRSIIQLALLDKTITLNEENIFNQFFLKTENLSYPVAGSFVGYLIENYSFNKFESLWKMEFKNKENINSEFLRIYEKSAIEIIMEYLQYVNA